MYENPRPVYSNELYHHGIKGQSWGVQNGPPYPLDKATSRAIKKEARAVNKDTKRSNKEFERASYLARLYFQKTAIARDVAMKAQAEYKRNPTLANKKKYTSSFTKAEDMMRRAYLWAHHVNKLNDKNIERANAIKKQYGDSVKLPKYYYHNKLVITPQGNRIVNAKIEAANRRRDDYIRNPFGLIGGLTMLRNDMRYRNAVEKSAGFDPKLIRNAEKNKDYSKIKNEYKRLQSNNTARHKGR